MMFVISLNQHIIHCKHDNIKVLNDMILDIICDMNDKCQHYIY